MAESSLERSLDADGGPVSWRELGCILAAAGVGLGLRYAAGLATNGLSHFDEGVYAISALWPWTGQFEPSQGFFSPPFYPWIVGCLGALCPQGETILGDQAFAQVNALFGTLSVVWVWRIARSDGGAVAGVLAGLLFAIDPLQIWFSKIGITDTVFCSLFLLSFFLVREGMARGGKWAVLAGIAVGFTWNTKYNGFLPLALGMGFAQGSLRTSIHRISLITSISLLLYLPWAAWFHVKQGYASLLEHQRGYVVGVGGIPAGIASGLEGWTHLAGCQPFLVLPLAALGLAFLPPDRRLGWGWTTLVMALLPAIYTPYLRLWLPTQALLLVLAAGGAVGLGRRLVRGFPRFGGLLAAVAALGGVVFLWFASQPGAGSPFERSEGIRTIGGELGAFSRSHDPPIYVLGRPSLIFYLAVHGGKARRLANADAIPPGPAFLVLDGLLPEAKELQSDIQKGAWPGLREVRRWPVNSSPIALLDYGIKERGSDRDILWLYAIQ